MAGLRRVLIANRGEIAVRVIRACREAGIESVAVYSDADRRALHVRLADQAYPIGPPPASESYLNAARLLETAARAGADALHPGYGFLSENADFADACAKAGITWIGPPGSAIRQMGDKVEARRRMKAAGVPIAPGSEGAVADFAAARKIADSIGYPVMIKAAAGGGGKGIRIVRHPQEFEAAFERARSEAEKSFKSGAVYVEKFLSRPRHVEIQVLADSHGNAIHLGERECSVQRRHQKVIEETPSCAVSPELRAKMGQAAVAAAKAVGYRNAGTVEFLLDESRSFSFLEMNTRLQVEHPITELVTGVDLVRAQLRIAAGEPLGLKQEDVVQRGHAIECRICAEDPDNDFLPSVGTIKKLDLPGGGGVRIDAGLFEGMKVDVWYDSLLAKLVVRGTDRAEAIAKMQRALAEFHVVGLKTNVGFLLRALEQDEFARGDYDTGFIERHREQLFSKPGDEEVKDVALLATVVAAEMRKARARGATESTEGASSRLSPWRMQSRGDRVRG